MKREVKFHITINEPILDWTFMILPAIFVKRTTSFFDGDNVTMIGLQWLVFQLLICFITKREQIPLGESNIHVD